MESLIILTEWGAYSFDATLEIQTKTSIVLPEYPTEQGVKVNDHRYAKPIEQRIKGIVTSVPMGFDIGSLISRLTRLTSTRPSTFIEALYNLQINGRPFILKSKYRTLNNMMIEEIIDNHTAQEDYSVTLDVKFKEFITVDKLTVQGQPNIDILPDNDVSRSANSATVRTGEVLTSNTSSVASSQADAMLSLL